MSDSGTNTGLHNFGDDEQNVADIPANELTIPKPKHRVQIVTSNNKSEDKRPKSDHTIRMRGNVLIQNPAQEWKVRSCELNGSFLTFFRKQKMVAAIDLEQVGDINILRQIKDSSGQGFIFSLHLKEGRYFNVRVSMYEDALNWVKVLIETRDKLRSSHQSRTKSFSMVNEDNNNYSSFTPLTSDFNTSLLVADEPDDNIKVYFDNDQYPPSPIFESNEKYVRPLQSKFPSDSANMASVGSPGSINSGSSGKGFSRLGSLAATSSTANVASPISSPVSSGGANKVKFDLSPSNVGRAIQPRSLTDGQEGGFGLETKAQNEGPVELESKQQNELEQEPVERVNESEGDDETVEPYDSAEESELRAQAAVAQRAKRDYLEVERLAAEQAEEERLAAMIQSARNARENAEKAALAKAAREEKLREDMAARQAKLAAEKAAQEELLITERAAKEARFAVEKSIREKKAAAEKLAREKLAAEKAIEKALEEERLAAERAQRVLEREVAAKKKLAEQAAAVKEAEKLERLRVQESAERKAKLHTDRRRSTSNPTAVAATAPAPDMTQVPSSPTKETEQPGPLVAGSLLGAVDALNLSSEDMWKLSRSFEHPKPGQLRSELNLDGIDLTVVDSPHSSPSSTSVKVMPIADLLHRSVSSLSDPKTSFYNPDGTLQPLPEGLSPTAAALATPPSSSLRRTSTTSNVLQEVTVSLSLTEENVSQHGSSSFAAKALDSPIARSSAMVASTVSPLPSSFDEVYDSVPSASPVAGTRFRNSQNHNAKRAATPERKRTSFGSASSSRSYSPFFLVCAALIGVALLVLGALGGSAYYTRYQAEEEWRRTSLEKLQAAAIAGASRSAEAVSKPTSIGSMGANAAARAPQSAGTVNPVNPQLLKSDPRGAGSSKGPVSLAGKPTLSAGGVLSPPLPVENQHALVRPNNVFKRFLSNLLRAPARFISNVFSKLASLFK